MTEPVSPWMTSSGRPGRSCRRRSCDYVAGGSGTESRRAGQPARAGCGGGLPAAAGRGGLPTPRPSCSAHRAGDAGRVAPMAYQRLAAPGRRAGDGRGCGRAAGVPMMLSTLSSYSIEQVAETGAELWFQLYWLRGPAPARAADRPGRGGRLQRPRGDRRPAGAWAGGCATSATRFTCRPSDRRQPAAMRQPRPSRRPDEPAHAAVPGRPRWPPTPASVFGPTLSWADLDWLRGRTQLPLIVKGILDPRDALRAVEVGADAVVVSNHGGRQFDGAPASIDALPRWWHEVGRRARCCWTAVSAAAPMCCGRWPSARPGCCSAGRCCGRWRSIGPPASGERCHARDRSGRGADPGRLPRRPAAGSASC